MEFKKTSFDLPKELLKKFKGLCHDNDKFMNRVVREIMNKWIMEQENKEVKE